MNNKLIIEGGKKAFKKTLNPAGSFPDSVKENVNRVLDEGRLFRYMVKEPENNEVSLTEKEFADYIGRKHAVAFNSCSSAMFTSLLIAGVKPGDNVFMPAFTFSAVPGSIVHANANPIMIDINEKYVIDLDSFKNSIAENPETKVLLLSYMRGHVPNLDKVSEICETNNITLIEDCAHALGTKWNGRSIGNLGLAACFSTQSYKMIDGGEGGFLVTDDDKTAAKAILYAGSYETNWKSHFNTELNPYLKDLQKKIPPFNFRMTMLNAATIRPQIGLIDSRAKVYNKKFERLVKILSKTKHIEIPKWDYKFEGVADSIQFNLIDLSNSQKQMFMELNHQEGIPVSLFGITKNNARCFWNWEYFKNNQNMFQAKEILYSACDMRLPFYLDDGDIDLLGNTMLKIIEYLKNDNKL